MVDHSTLKIQNRDVLDAGLFFNPLFGLGWQGEFAQMILQDDLPRGS